MKKTNEKAKKDIIKTLDTREQCRDKLPIFFGSRDNYIHGVKEVVANAIDEISNNFDKGEIIVELFEDEKTISVFDTGRGVPIEKETDGKPNYVLLFETLFAGSNFENNENKKITVGTNGCGTCVLNHTSELFKVNSGRDGKEYELIYENGGTFKRFKVVGKTDASFSKFTFRLDREVYTNIVYKAEELKDICKHNAAVNNKITITFRHKGEAVKYHYDNVEEYFNEVTLSKTCPNVVGVNKHYKDTWERDRDVFVTEENNVNVILATSSEPVQQTFLNSNYLPQKGTIHDGIINGVRLFTNKYCNENKLIDKKIGAITKEDIEESISFVAAINSTNVEYENQIKLATQKKLYKTIAQSYIQDLLQIMLIEKPKDFEKLIKHILEVQKFNNKARASKSALKKKLSEKIDNLSNRVEGLVDCKIHGPEAELFIAEGRSALGSIVLARNPKNQAAIPIRGKILNCLKADYQTIFKNEIILDLIRCLGCGVETDKKNKDLGEFDINALRYGRIMIATDADPDGAQIQCLLLTMFYRLTPTLINEGRVYIVKTPLYEVKCGDEITYIYSEEEKADKLKAFEGKRYTLSRAKGLGELDAQVMSDTGVNPETRNVEQVTVENITEMIKTFEIWMGQDVTDRKAIIESSLDKFIEEVM